MPLVDVIDKAIDEMPEDFEIWDLLISCKGRNEKCWRPNTTKKRS
jgi:hypothetical protein